MNQPPTITTVTILPRAEWSYPGDVPEWRLLMRRLSGPEKLAAGAAINRRVNSVLLTCLRQQYPAWPEERIQRKQKQITLIASLDPGCTLPEQFLAPVE